MQTGVLLVNVGTPPEPTTTEVRRYLRRFLMDGRVIDVPAPLRWILTNLIIAPFRAPRSAAAYQRIWSEAGSPIQVHMSTLAEKLETALDDTAQVRFAMAYGQPDLEDVLSEMHKARFDELIVVPLYPQYASATNGSVQEAVFRWMSKQLWMPAISVLPPFFQQPGFLEAWDDVWHEAIQAFAAPDHVLFSFHGLPERQVRNTGGEHCLSSDHCCSPLGHANSHCYRAQSIHTATTLAKRWNLDPSATSISFQSRLGRAAWIQPYTAERLAELGKQKVRSLWVVAPSFVSDCLETLEELGMEGQEIFQEAGGGDFKLLPSLNSRPVWVNSLAAMIQSRQRAHKPQA